MIWFLQDLARLAAERAAIQSLEEETTWLTGTSWRLDNTGLSLDAVLHVHDRDWAVHLVYPELFPSAPIYIRPQEAGEHWSAHQYGDGTLCLEWGPDNWHPEVTGRQMLESTHRLLSAENPRDATPRQIAPSRHQVTLGQTLRGRVWRVYVGSALHERLKQTLEDASVDFVLHFQRKSVLVVLQTVRCGAEAWKNPDVPSTLREKDDSVLLKRGRVRRVPVVLKDVGLPTTVDGIEKLLAEHGQPPLGDAPISVLLLDGEGSPHFLHRFEDETELAVAATLRPETEASQARLSLECEKLVDKIVGVVGLGSVGSKIAVSLARSGISRFLLVDEDVFLPENVVRHALDLHSTGEHKADAVATAIERVSPVAQVVAERVHLTGQESNAAVNGVLRRLGRCDLLIDATADARLFSLLAAVAKVAGKPFVWMEVFAGGIGGLIARHRPGLDPSPTTIRRVFHQFTVDHPAEEVEDVGRYAVESGGQLLTATDADVSVVASMATQFSIDTLVERQPSAYPYAMYLVGFRRSWVFETPLHVIPIETSHVADPADPATDELASAVVLEFLRGLLQEAEE